MEKVQKQSDVRQMDFTITRTEQMFWLNIKLKGKDDYIIELNSDDALNLAEEFDEVIRTDEGTEEDDNWENA